LDGKKNIDPQFWTINYDTSKVYSWQGYTFELVCFTHIQQIKKALGISGIATSISTWRSKTDGDNTQIDLLIDRRDHIINVCEAKFSHEPYIIDKDYESKLLMRNAIFKSQTKTNKALSITFITISGIMPNTHSGIVRNEVKAEDLFAEI
jgi:hypothetical protein